MMMINAADDGDDDDDDVAADDDNDDADDDADDDAAAADDECLYKINCITVTHVSHGVVDPTKMLPDKITSASDLLYLRRHGEDPVIQLTHP